MDTLGDVAGTAKWKLVRDTRYENCWDLYRKTFFGIWKKETFFMGESAMDLLTKAKAYIHPETIYVE